MSSVPGIKTANMIVQSRIHTSSMNVHDVMALCPAFRMLPCTRGHNMPSQCAGASSSNYRWTCGPRK